MKIIVVFLLIVFSTLVLIPFINVRWKGYLALFVVSTIAFYSTFISFPAFWGNNVEFVWQGFSVFGDVPIRIDALSAWFILIINLTCFNGILYGIGYMKSYSDQKANLSLHWILFSVFQLSMLMVCVVQNGLVFLIVWELMSLSSLLLVIFEQQKTDTVKAGINYLVQMHISVIFLTTAFIWVYYSQGSYDFNAIAGFFSSQRNLWLFLLFFVGFGFKAGFIPFHSWLPHAHPAAPSHISGVMSGVIVKLGIFGIIRMALMLKSDILLIGEIVLIVSILTGLFGILNAAVHRDFKKMLAYCTIENIGIIGVGIGLGLIGIGTSSPILTLLGFSAALLHTLNHSLFKSLLFFSAGSVYQQTHTRDMEKLGGLIHKMPQTTFFFLIGAIAIGGLPPFNGFVSEFLIYSGFLSGLKDSEMVHSIIMMLSLAGMAIIGGLSILAFTKSFSTIFLGTPRSELHSIPAEVSLIMRIPQFIIVFFMLSIGLFPQFYFSVIFQVVHSSMPTLQLANSLEFQSTIQLLADIGKYSLLFILVIGLIFLLRSLVIKNRLLVKNTTWGCGYVAPKYNMQYTSKSFSKTLGKLFGFVVSEKKNYTELTQQEIFPVTRNHSSYYADFFEKNIFEKSVSKILQGMGFFGFLQNGKIQSYVLYGVFFILMIIIGSFIGII
jgi:hydrogenase-4 component B